jgi:hypothetical protein
LDDWLPEGLRLDGEAALAELALRYFRSHGPATVHDFAWWAGLSVGEARAAARLSEPELTRTDVDGRTLWFAPDGSSEAGGDAGDSVHLLPYFDEYTVAYRDRSDVLDAKHARKVANGGMLNPTLVSRGEVKGTWRRRVRKGRVEVSLEPFGRLTGPEQEGVRAAATRYGAFLGLEGVTLG